MERLNFSWLVEGKIAGHGGPISEEKLRYLKSRGLGALVRLAEEPIAQVTTEQVARVGLDDLHLPVPDFSAPTIGQIERALSFILDSIGNGKAVGVSCGAGYGRTGTILACYLVNRGWAADRAIQEVRSKRPGSIETEEQEKTIRVFAAHHRTGTDQEKHHRELGKSFLDSLI